MITEHSPDSIIEILTYERGGAQGSVLANPEDPSPTHTGRWSPRWAAGCSSSRVTVRMSRSLARDLLQEVSQLVDEFSVPSVARLEGLQLFHHSDGAVSI